MADMEQPRIVTITKLLLSSFQNSFGDVWEQEHWAYRIRDKKKTQFYPSGGLWCPSNEKWVHRKETEGPAGAR